MVKRCHGSFKQSIMASIMAHVNTSIMTKLAAGETESWWSTCLFGLIVTTVPHFSLRKTVTEQNAFYIKYDS